MRKPVLVVLAAGMGSRYGGLKQLDPVGANGELIIDYSLYDARRAGFEDVVFLIKSAIDSEFREVIGDRISKVMNVAYAYQEMDKLPDGFAAPEGRVKPFGTTHAVLCAKQEIGDRPFCVINSDDYYGPESYRLIYDFLCEHAESRGEYAMSGYILKNTLSDSGSVARGVCEQDGDYLKTIVERTSIVRTADGASYTDADGAAAPLCVNSLVSLNFWGFTPDAFGGFERDFARYLENEFAENPLKAESLLPNTVGAMIKQGVSVRVLTSHDRWHGVTYKEDKPEVVAAMAALTESGLYPSPLWK